MNNAPQKYLLDANVFIEAHRRYYSFDICPGFWECILYHNKASSIFSIDRVKDEMKAGDELGAWTKSKVSSSMFHATDESEVSLQFAAIMQWVQGSTQFKDEAKEKFAEVADGWLVAFAKTHGYTVVTQEVYDAMIKKSVPIPNLCKEFHVSCIDTFAMLRSLTVRFNWQPNAQSASK